MTLLVLLLLAAWAKAKLADPAGETCQECGHALTVGERLDDRCKRCGARPSHDPHADVPF